MNKAMIRASLCVQATVLLLGVIVGYLYCYYRTQPKPVTLSFTFNNITSQKAKELTDAVTERLVQRGILPPFKEVRR